MKPLSTFHPYPSLYLFLLFSAGISLAWYFGKSIHFEYSLIAAGFLLVLLIFFYSRKDVHFFYLFLFSFFLAGCIHGLQAFFSFSEEENNLFNNQIEAIQGTIIESTYRQKKTDSYILECEKILTKDQLLPAQGEVVISQGKYPDRFKYGDVIRIYGKPKQPDFPLNPGEFNYRNYLQLHDRFFTLRLNKESRVIKIISGKGNWSQIAVFNPVREKIKSVIDSYLPVQSASIVKALIIGERSDLSRDIIDDFQKTGVIHVLAISGLHVGFIALILQFSLSLLRIPKKISMALTILFLVFFLALVDFKAPVVRASLMVSIYYLAKFTIRPQKTLNVIALSGLLILLFQPEQLLLPGFQYSFAAVFGLIYGGSKLEKIIPSLKSKTLFKRLFNRFIRSPLISSFAAILATLPLTWYYYGSIQIGALIANIFVIPVIGIIVFLSIFLLIISPIAFLPAAGVAYLIDNLISVLIGIISGFAKIPFVQVTTGHPGFVNLLIVLALIFFIFNVANKKAQYGIVFSVLLLWMINFAGVFSQNLLRVTFIHVGQGDGTLIEFPNNKTALIDAGDKNYSFDAGQRYIEPVLKYYGISKINYLIGSHPHSDHIGGFEFILMNYPVDTLILNSFTSESKLYDRIIRLARQNKVSLKYVDQGDIIVPDNEIRMYVLHPTSRFEDSSDQSGESTNNSSLIIKMVHGENSFLYSGDAEIDAEKETVHYAKFLQSDVLKVGHHGSKTSTSDTYLSFVKPQYALISVGTNNKFKHPSPFTVNKLQREGARVFFTNTDGALVLESDGKILRQVDWR